MNCKSCHPGGTPARIVLHGEERCPSCQTYQRPPAQGWGRSHDRTRLQRLSCEDARRKRLPHQLARLVMTAASARFDLCLCDRSDLDENNNGVNTVRHEGLDTIPLLPVLCMTLHKSAACQILASAPDPGTGR